ncbi:MAG: hypothetical protein V2A66_03190 [Pseudomonadota bacterium]
MRFDRYIMIVFLVVVSVCSAPRRSDAAFSGMLSRAAAWWSARSVDEKKDDKLAGGNAQPASPPAAGASGQCQTPREPSATVCEAGSGFLCVATPPGGVAEDSFVLKGAIDRQGSVVADIRVAVQNEYTKSTAIVDTSKPVDGDCWGSRPKGAPFCLASDGRFSAVIPLAAKGPYTVVVSASRLSGKPEEKSVRVSRVVALKMADKDVKFSPDVRASRSVDSSFVQVTVNLLGSCRFCDFIGASTGGVRVSVENVIKDAAGKSRRIGCETSTEQGGQGQFIVGVPVGAGTNTISVRACNAAAKDGACQQVSGISFSGKGESDSFSITSPPPAPTYDPAQYPSIPWKFSLGRSSACATLKFNREASRETCPDKSGQFSVELKPRVGINVATLSREKGTEAFGWTFGWGEVRSPFGGGDGSIDVPQAASLVLPAATARDILVPLVNNFLKSDELHGLIGKLFGGNDSAAKSTDKAASTTAAPAPAIPKCEDSSLGGLGVSLRGEPKIDGAEITSMTFGDGRIYLSASLKGVRVGLSLAPDLDGDGKSDLPPLPIVIAFRSAVADIAIVTSKDGDGKPLLLLEGVHDDCSFKGSYCKHMPAALVPQNFVGDANAWGGFIECEEAAVESSEVKTACRAVNSLNAQTGIVAEKVLDAINNAIYCGGSASLTQLARDGIALSDVHLGCANAADCKGTISGIFPPVSLPLVVKLNGLPGITASGLVVNAGLLVGNRSLYAATPEKFCIGSAGYIAGKKGAALTADAVSSQKGDIGASVYLDAVDALLYAATAQGDGFASKGLLDFDIDENFFSSFGFDFVKECDAFKPVEGKDSASSLCFLRPRVSEMLGTALASYGYFNGNLKQPLMIAIRGNRALGPRLNVATLDELPAMSDAEGDAGKKGGGSDVPTGSLVQLELGGVTLSFYALEVDASREADEYGNLPVKMDQAGKPIIHSMRPEEKDPWRGPIVTFDLTLLLGIELGPVEQDKKDESKFAMMLRPLADRSRLVLTPENESNATTVPATALVSSLADKLKLAIAGLSPRDKAISIPIPRNIALGAPSPDSMFGALGLRDIAFGPKGLSLDFDPKENAIRIAIQAAITQVLHEGGKEIKRTVP